MNQAQNPTGPQLAGCFSKWRVPLATPLALMIFLSGTGCRSSPPPASVSTSSLPNAGTTTVVTLNVRYDNPADGPDAWSNRAEAVVQALAGFEADVIGLQEVLPGQAARIAAGLPGFGMLIRSREAIEGRGEAVPILWRASAWRLDPEANGTFWLSETPHVPGTRSWDSSLPRIVTWARLLPVPGPEEMQPRSPLWVFNTHFDHRGPEARFESAAMLVDRILDWCDPDEPVVLVGDFNARPDEPPILRIVGGDATDPPLVDCWSSLNPEGVEDATWNGFEFVESGSRIDYVFARGLSVRSATIDRPTTTAGRPISDHWPVRVVFGPGGRSDGSPP